MISFAAERSKEMSRIGWIWWGFVGGIIVAFLAYPLDFYIQLLSFPYPDETYEKLLGLSLRAFLMGGAGAVWSCVCRSQNDWLIAFTLGTAGPAFFGALLAANTPYFLNNGNAQPVSFEIRLISPSYAVGTETDKIAVSKKERDWIVKELENTEALIADFRELLHIAHAIRRVLRRELGALSPEAGRNSSLSSSAREIDLDISILVKKINEKKVELNTIKEKLKIMTVKENEEPEKSSFRENFIKGLIGRR